MSSENRSGQRVLLDEADTRLVVDVLGYLGRVATENGRRPTPKVEALRRRLQSRVRVCFGRTVSDGASLSGPTRPRLLPEGYELVDTAQAARLPRHHRGHGPVSRSPRISTGSACRWAVAT